MGPQASANGQLADRVSLKFDFRADPAAFTVAVTMTDRTVAPVLSATVTGVKQLDVQFFEDMADNICGVLKEKLQHLSRNEGDPQTLEGTNAHWLARQFMHALERGFEALKLSRGDKRAFTVPTPPEGEEPECPPTTQSTSREEQPSS